MKVMKMKIWNWLLIVSSSFLSLIGANALHKQSSEGVEVSVHLQVSGKNTNPDKSTQQWVFNSNAVQSLMITPEMTYIEFLKEIKDLVLSPNSDNREIDVTGPDGEIVTKENFAHYRDHILRNSKNTGFTVTLYHDGPFPLSIE